MSQEGWIKGAGQPKMTGLKEEDIIRHRESLAPGQREENDHA